MLIYIIVILSCFLLSTIKLPKFVENGALILIAFFLCFGYMTGTDWYLYEQYYDNPRLSEEVAKSREFGYFLLQTFFKTLGFNFWTFHILVKLLVFYSIISFVRWLNVNIFLFLALLLPEVGFYLFIDCPFRNLIAFGFALIAFRKLFQNKTLSYFIYVFVATSFHLSAVILLFVFFVYKKEMKTYFVFILTIIIYILAYNIDFLISNVYVPLAKIIPLVNERLGGYFLDSRFISDKFNIGALVRLFTLFILLLYKETIISNNNKRRYIYILAIVSFLIYPFGATMKIFHRFYLYLIPFYILSIILLLQSFTIKTNKYLLYSFFVLFSLTHTYTLIRQDYRYVPYTNYLFYCSKQKYQDIEYRYQYNKTHSPYKTHSPQ